MKAFRPSPALVELLRQLAAIGHRSIPTAVAGNMGNVIAADIPALPPLPLPSGDPLEQAFYQHALLPAYQRIQAMRQTAQAPAAPAPSAGDAWPTSSP